MHRLLIILIAFFVLDLVCFAAAVNKADVPLYEKYGHWTHVVPGSGYYCLLQEYLQ